MTKFEADFWHFLKTADTWLFHLLPLSQAIYPGKRMQRFLILPVCNHSFHISLEKFTQRVQCLQVLKNAFERMISMKFGIIHTSHFLKCLEIGHSVHILRKKRLNGVMNF